VGPTWAYPVAETQYIRFGAVYEDAQLLTSSLGSAIQAQDWVQQNGHPYSRVGHDDSTNNEYVFYGTNFKDFDLVAGYDWDSRNKTLFADHGSHFSISLSSTVPGADVEYYIADASFVHYVPLWKGFTFVSNAAVDYGEPFGKTTAIPPYRQFFGGGPDNVRGFRESRLGPADQFGNPYGGNLRITNQNELIFPMPAKWRSSARVSAFFDMGGVYETGDKIAFWGPDGVTPETYHLNSFGDLRRSVGIAVQWLAPLGLFRFSLGVPLNAQHSTQYTKWGDQTEVFQFSIGQAF
jgi:outer membrane protein insertion porin family